MAAAIISYASIDPILSVRYFRSIISQASAEKCLRRLYPTSIALAVPSKSHRTKLCSYFSSVCCYFTPLSFLSAQEDKHAYHDQYQRNDIVCHFLQLAEPVFLYEKHDPDNADEPAPLISRALKEHGRRDHEKKIGQLLLNPYSPRLFRRIRTPRVIRISPPV